MGNVSLPFERLNVTLSASLRWGPTLMYRAHLYTQNLHCIECGRETTRYMLFWFGEFHVDGIAGYRQWAREMHYPLEEEIFHQEGLCDKCYDGRNDEEIRLIRRLEVYSRNIQNIEKENYRQDGAREKHLKYQLLIRTSILSWTPKTVFIPSPIYDEQNRLFYTRYHMTSDDLEQWIEIEAE
jgi:hypothetical protein